jgi:hypothetical protein
MWIPCHRDPSLPLKISQKPGKTSTKFQHYMHLMHLIILYYCNVTWLSISLWIYGRTWTPWGFFSMGNTLPKLYHIITIAYNNGPNATHGGTITSSDAYHKVTKWFLHHMNGLVLFKRYIRSLDTFGVKRTYSLLAPHYHWRGMYVQVWDGIARCEQCDRVRTSFSFRQLTLSSLPIQGMFYR